MYVSNYLYYNNLSIHLVRTIKDEIKKNNELLIQCLKKKE